MIELPSYESVLINNFLISHRSIDILWVKKKHNVIKVIYVKKVTMAIEFYQFIVANPEDFMRW